MEFNRQDYRILVAEDEAIFRALIARTLETVDYRTVTAEDGAMAASILAEGDVDLVIADLVMPRMDGIQLAQLVRKEYPRIPVVIATGQPSLDTALAAIREGVYDYLTKPFAVRELQVTVDNAIEKVSIERENQRLMAELEKTHLRLLELERTLQACRDKDTAVVSHERIADEIDRLQSFQNRVLPFQYSRGGGRPSSSARELEALNVLRRSGRVGQTDYEHLKSRILEEG